MGEFLEGLILLTTWIAAVAKKLLNDSAITEGSVMTEPLTFKVVQLSFFVLGLRIALDRICQVLRKFFEFFSIWE